MLRLNSTLMGICSNAKSWNRRRRMITCPISSRMFQKNMNTPYDTLGKATLSTYPVDEIGVLPVADFVTTTMPAAMTTIPMASRHQRSARCCFMLLLSVGGWGLGIVSEMVLPKPYIDCRHTGVFSQPNFFKKVEIRGCAVGSFPVIYIERATKYAIRSLGSAGEHRLHTAGVTGSNPVATTTNDKAGIKWFRPFSFECVEVDSSVELRRML